MDQHEPIRKTGVAGCSLARENYTCPKGKPLINSMDELRSYMADWCSKDPIIFDWLATASAAALGAQQQLGAWIADYLFTFMALELAC